MTSKEMMDSLIDHTTRSSAPGMPQSDTPRLADTLKRDVYDLCLPEGRKVGTQGHQNAIEFLTRRLSEIGCDFYRGSSFELTYRVGGQDFSNLVGVVPGKNRQLSPLLIGAHYDSVIEAPCADDNGAAVAMCLALGQMATASGGPERDIVVALFDAAL